MVNSPGVDAVNTTTVWGANSATSGVTVPSSFASNFSAWFLSLPTVDPLVAGQFWNNGGTLAESTGIGP